ncbi:class I SAM-dependent methyltransferase [soil metagenome]
MAEPDGVARDAPRWARFTAQHPSAAEGPPDDIAYGADVPHESRLRLLGDVEGKRVLDLGCGAGRGAIALALRGAKVIAVDPSAEQLAHARRAVEDAEVRVELHHGDVAALAFVRADGIDAAFSAYGLAGVADLDRVFRQVHRVLKPDAPLVLSLPHPAFTMLALGAPAAGAEAGALVRRAYGDRSAIPRRHGDDDTPDAPHTVGDVFTSLLRSNFRVDTLLEPEPETTGPRSVYWHDAMALVPPTIIFRARKLGT